MCCMQHLKNLKNSQELIDTQYTSTIKKKLSQIFIKLEKITKICYI